MDLKSFSNPSGKLYKNKDKNVTFVPNPLPPKIKYDDSMIHLLSEAEFLLGKLDGIGTLIPNPHLLIRPYVLREAVYSSKIEGTQASISDIFNYQTRKKIGSEQKNKRIGEVVNYVHALDDCLEKIKRGEEIDLALITGAHKILMHNVRGNELNPSMIRNIQNWIGPEDTKIENATYVPPPAEFVLDLLHNLGDFLKNPPKEMPVLIQCAIMHYQFEAIHPFIDGNGRIGRLLISSLLVNRGLLEQPLLYLSAFIEKNKTEYYHLMLNVSKTGDWNAWIRFFLLAIITQTQDVITNIQELMALRKRYQSILYENKASASSIRLAEYIFAQPYLTMHMVQEYLDVTYPPAKRAISVLEGFGILKKSSAQKRNKVYVAHEIMKILS